jgi:curved DNA-binding protein CbpA
LSVLSILYGAEPKSHRKGGKELKMNYFKTCKTIEDAKAWYRKLLLQNHPDHAGKAGEAATIEIINQFNKFVDNFMTDSFHAYYADKDDKPSDDIITPFQDILKKIIDFDCEIEIIGYWIYCFKSYEAREALKELGFWFSSKHKAWIFSGGKKTRFYSKKTLNEIRAEKGSRKVHKAEKEEEKKTRKALKKAS